MNLSFLASSPWTPVYANDNDALAPELWAQESLLQLEENMVAANLVYRDFEDSIQKEGDTVNAHLPGSFEMKRKTNLGTIVNQDAVTTNVPIVLNQHIYASFIIGDDEQSKSFKDLVNLHLGPAVRAIASGIDQIVLGQAYQFLGYAAGNLGTTPDNTDILRLGKLFDENKVPPEGRNLIITPSQKEDFLALELFVSAEKVGDDGTALREASLGRKLGFNTYMCQNAPSIAAGNTAVTGAINLSAGYAAGATSITVDGLSAAVTAGSWFTVAGDMTPQMILTSTGGTVPTALTFTPGLRNAVVNDAVVTIYTPGAINLTAGYAANNITPLAVDGFSVAPRSGQMISLGNDATADIYSAINTPTTTAIDIERPLDAIAANDTVVGIGPPGDYGFAFHREALALVIRPLALPMSGLVRASVVSYNGLSIRVVISYNAERQGHQVTIDLLAGIKTLNSLLGAVLFS